MNPDLPFEVLEFEQLLQKPNSDASGLASFLGTGEIWVTRVPARLDVMGGIADYSGANVCQAVLGRGVLMGLQLISSGRGHYSHNCLECPELAENSVPSIGPRRRRRMVRIVPASRVERRAEVPSCSRALRLAAK